MKPTASAIVPVALAVLWPAETVGSSHVPLLALAASLPHIPLALLPATAALVAARARRLPLVVLHLVTLAAVLAWCGVEVPGGAAYTALMSAATDALFSDQFWFTVPSEK